MYSHFCRNLENYFRIHADSNPDEYRLKIAQVLRGIPDIKLYNHWKLYDFDMYEELNNLIFEIGENLDIHGYETFSRDLYYMDFVAEKSDKYSADREKIEEQLKLVDLLLGHQYCP